MSAEANAALGKQFFQAQDRLKGGPDPALCTSAYAARIGGMPAMDRAGHEQFAKVFYGAFPDIFHTIDETVADADRVAVRFTLRGTHRGNFMGLPPTGKSIEVGAIAILDVKDGKVTALHAIFDQAGMMMQLGAGAPA